MYIGSDEIGKIKIRKFVKRAIGKKGAAILKKAGKLVRETGLPLLPFGVSTAAEAAIRAFEKRKGRPATSEEIEQITESISAPATSSYIPYIGIGIGALFLFGLLKRRR